MVDEVQVNIWDWIGEFPKREIKIQLTNEAAAKNNKMDAVFCLRFKKLSISVNNVPSITREIINEFKEVTRFCWNSTYAVVENLLGLNPTHNPKLVPANNAATIIDKNRIIEFILN